MGGLNVQHYKIKIQYNGYGYYGFQTQRNPKLPTIQDKIENAIKAISKSDDLRVLGSGRTDAGVHAFGQVVKISMPLNIDPESLVKALNVNLPKDIKVIKAALTDEAFHPISNAESKEYRYYFKCSFEKEPFLDNLLTIVSAKDLNLEKITDALSILEGEHDFQNYFTVGTPVKDTIRTIYEAELLTVPTEDIWESGALCVRLVGSGFLKQMVRLLMGAIIDIGKEKLKVSEFESSLNQSFEKKLAALMPANGLYLYKVNYPDNF